MSRYSDRPFLRFALIGLAVAALGLAACGRKGDLDPPPGASLAGEQSNTPGPLSNPVAAPIGGRAKDGDQGVRADGQPLAPKGPKKQIPLDVLLN